MTKYWLIEDFYVGFELRTSARRAHRNSSLFLKLFTLCNHFAVCLSKENFVPFRILSPNWVLSQE